MCCASIPAYGIQRANFHQKMKLMNLQYFCIFIYIWWLLKFVGVFFVWKAYQTCRHARTFQLVSQQSLASINNKTPKILTKRPPVATTVPSGTQRHHWGIGIPGYTFGCSIQTRAIPQPSWGSCPRWLQAVYRVSNGRSYLQLYRKGAYIHYLWLYSENTVKKVLFDES